MWFIAPGSKAVSYHYLHKRNIKALRMILKLDDGKNNLFLPISSRRDFKACKSNDSWDENSVLFYFLKGAVHDGGKRRG